MDELDVRLAVHELQQRVAALEAQVAALTGSSSGHPSLSGVPSAPLGGPETDPEVLAHLQSGNEIGAIKSWREKTGLGLAEAKYAVDQARKRLNL